jgi:hypothetical protein
MANSTADPAPTPIPVSASVADQARATPVKVRVLAFLVATITAQAAALGIWFMPFLVGMAAGAFAARGLRKLVWPATAGAVAGWAILLWAQALLGLPIGATARAIAALAGLPPYSAVAIAVTLLLAALQALTGAWLARAITPRHRG